MRFCLFFFPTLAFFLSSLSHYGQSDGLSFPEIRIRISNGEFSKLQDKGLRVSIKDAQFLINGDSAKVKEVHSRGNNSLNFEHKSLSVELDKAFTLYIDGAKAKIKKFDLLNLVMDKNLWHNRWAYLTMSKIGIFPLCNTYCTLWINDQPQGVYLLVEKPQHYTASIKSPYTVRRGTDHKIHNDYAEGSRKEERKKYKKQYRSIYSDIKEYKDNELYDKLKSKLLVDQYFLWLAFNYLIMNGDYADEVFLYIRPENGLFCVIPWDYDDILLHAPHEGMTSRNSVEGMKNKLIFSSEEALDRAIALDEYMYKQYLDVFRNMLVKLTPELLQQVSDKVSAELMRVSENQEIARASLFLGKEPFQKEEGRLSILTGVNFLVNRRNVLLAELK